MLRRLLDAYIYSDTLSYRARMSNMTFLTSVGVSSLGLLFNIIISGTPAISILLAVMIVSSVIIFYISNRKGLQLAVSWGETILMNTVFLPLLIFFTGGLHSGNTAVPLMGMVVIVVVLRGNKRYLLLALTLLWYTLLEILSLSYPNAPIIGVETAALDENITFLYNVACMVLSVIFISALIVYQFSLYALARKRALELAERIDYRLRQQLMVSHISQSFLGKGDTGKKIQRALEALGEFLDASRVAIVKRGEDGTLCRPKCFWISSPEYELPEEGTLGGFDESVADIFPPVVPKSEAAMQIVCSNVETDRNGRFAAWLAVGIKAFVWVPLYIDGEYWGCLSVEDCAGPRDWSSIDSNLVSIIAFSIAGAISRNLMDIKLNDALEQALAGAQAKSEFLSNMSHEMRTPMTAIIGMSDIGLRAESILRKDYSFTKIQEASTHLLGVINDVLDISKIEAGKLELSSAEFIFEKTLQKVLNVANYQLLQKNQVLKVYCDPEIPYSLVGDDQHLAQVITNLLSNAIKFTPEGGVIEVNARFKGESAGLCDISISVKDNGIGMNEEQQALLFSAFQQADRSVSRRFGGTGLGLAISKSIVNLMGGDFDVSSSPGSGSVFCFNVLMPRGTQTFSVQDALEDYELPHKRALVVDDDPDTLEHFSMLAEELGLPCDEALSALEAVALIDKHGAYDLYFIDWRMPETDGLELSEKIRETSGSVPIIVMITAADWGSVADEAQRAGVNSVIQKPLFASSIIDSLTECLGSERRSLGDADAIPNFSDRTILLSEDVEINREIVLALLEPTGVAVDTAETGAQALASYTAAPEKYSLLLMDLQMPEMDGFEATRRIRAFELQNALPRRPIIAMTANVFREDVEKCLAAGMDQHLGKPIEPDELIRVLREYML
ncbi:MAG: response regulator [Oscillospiraceae bacterium]|jgi:signal transduction histidine kinase/DNA-binding response OmpR family regulator|nr:response regulator [Oscillospiraceae bacterium]